MDVAGGVPLGVGARPTDRVNRFLDDAGIMKREPRNNPKKALPGKKRQEREEAERQAAEEAKAAAEEAAEAPAEEAPSDAPDRLSLPEQPIRVVIYHLMISVYFDILVLIGVV